MKQFYFIILFVVLFSGCKTDNNNHGYGYNYDSELPSGMMVRFDGNARKIDNEILNQAYLDTIQCTGITPSNPPLVVFVDHEINNDSDYLVQGKLYFDTGLILVMSLDQYPENWSVLVLQHELVHYLLLESGYPTSMNVNHESDLFSKCSY